MEQLVEQLRNFGRKPVEYKSTATPAQEHERVLAKKFLKHRGKFSSSQIKELKAIWASNSGDKHPVVTKYGIPIDWEWYDQFRKETSTPSSYFFDVFNEEGKKIGQIQPFPFTDGYKAVAACYHLGHKDGCKKSRCARIRSLKPDKGELPMHVDRVLIKWLIDGQKQLNKANHEKLRHD